MTKKVKAFNHFSCYRQLSTKYKIYLIYLSTLHQEEQLYFTQSLHPLGHSVTATVLISAIKEISKGSEYIHFYIAGAYIGL
jgi:hypothetical protein